MIKFNENEMELFNKIYNIFLSPYNGECIFSFSNYKFAIELLDSSEESNNFQLKTFGEIGQLPYVFKFENNSYPVAIVFPKCVLQQLNISFETFIFLIFHEIGHIMNGDQSVDNATTETEIKADSFSLQQLDFTKEEKEKICKEFFDDLYNLIPEKNRYLIKDQFDQRKEMILKETY